MEASDELQAGRASTAAAQTAVIISNPVSGSFPHHHHDYRDTITFLQAQGWQVELWPTHNPGDAQTLARRAVEQHIAVVIAAGGDGTLNEVIQELAGSETRLGVLPMGTVNVWAREMGIPLDSAKARDVLVHGRTCRVDLGRVNGRYFLLMAGIGIDGEVTQAVERKPLKRLGVLGYLLAALWFGPGYLGFPLTLKVDEAAPIRTRALEVIVGNTRLYAGAFQFTWMARCDDGLLDLCMVHKRGRLGRLVVLFDFALNREQRRLWVRYSTFKSLTIETPEPVAIQVDGDPAGHTPATFTVAPGALKVIVPQGTASELFST
ncbi:MAG TPA: diacylglycerol kinase family protein [Ktedonobacteraceae bacterium]|jgi:diacylglycerol kinase (ATP)|nr:diacylglycerol kinase family protein [Ktedonobacteraceae bacterium]